MLPTRHFLRLITLTLHCTLFAADSPHCSGWEELLITLFKQSSLQPHLTHHSAYPLVLVSKKLTELMDEHRATSSHILWQMRSSNCNVMNFPLSNGVFINKESVTFDASCNIAYGVSEGLGTLFLCRFTCPSRRLLNHTLISPGVIGFVNNISYKTFFGRGIGFVGFAQEDKAHIVGYLPTGCMFRKSYNYGQDDIEKIIFYLRYDHISQRSGMGCTIDYVGGRAHAFSTDTSTVVKDCFDAIIPWQKIAWDTKS